MAAIEWKRRVEAKQKDLDAVGVDLADLAKKLGEADAEVARLKLELEARGDATKEVCTHCDNAESPTPNRPACRTLH
jgi:hypothetical protein